MTADDQHLWQLTLHAEPLKLARLDPGSPVPDWARSGAPLSSVSWNAHETSVIAAAQAVPVGVHQAGPFQAFEIDGPLDFTLVGVLSGLLEPLAVHQVNVITTSTFDTDWILVPVEQVEVATRAWRAQGHRIRVAEPAARVPGAPGSSTDTHDQGEA